MLSVGPEKAFDLIDLRIQTQSAAAMFSMKVYTVLQSTAAPRTKTVNRAEVWFGARTVSLFLAGRRRCCHTRLPKFTEKLEIPKDYQTFTMLQ